LLAFLRLSYGYDAGRMSEGERPSVSLEYSTPLPWHRRARGRALVFLCALSFILLGIDRYGLRIQRRAKLLYLQQQCMGYTPPADAVVYDSRNESSRMPTPPCWEEFSSIAALPTDHDRTWFVGQRRIRGGDIVIIHVGVWYWLRPSVRLIRPATLFRRPEVSKPTQVRVGTGWPTNGEFRTGRAWVGQSDPEDNSRFSLPLEHDGRKTIIEGWLEDDGKTAILRIVHPGR